MGLAYLDISNFRNFISTRLKPTLNGFNFFYGVNGSGKTSFLEAIYYLSMGRSFRTSVANNVISHQTEKLSIFADFISKIGQNISIGIERHQTGEIKMRVNGQDVYSIAEIVQSIPVQLIDAHCHNLLEAGPSYRRKYLDWGIFYLNKDFLRIWRQFERALRQRNAALRQQIAPKEIESWTRELVENAEHLDRLRTEYINGLIPQLKNMIADLLPSMKKVEISYQAGWKAEEGGSYQEILNRYLDKDRQLGYTQWGPHKADLKIMINEASAKAILSKGQQKLFVCAMILARGVLLQSYGNIKPIYLIDDLPAELDLPNRWKLIDLLSRQETQVFVTAIERENGDDFQSYPTKMFHVEQGEMKEISR